VSEGRPGSESRGRSLVCFEGSHNDCGHIGAAIRTAKIRRRLESTVILCRCPCHASCTLAGRMPVSLTVWQLLCACPGAEFERSWREDPDEPWPGAREHWERSQRESQERHDARRDAFRAAKDAASGKTREETRDIYLAELRARGQEIPEGLFLEADLDLMSGHPLRSLKRMLRMFRT